jgi:hypothetical protein
MICRRGVQRLRSLLFGPRSVPSWQPQRAASSFRASQGHRLPIPADSVTGGRPQRRIDDHIHPEYWTEMDHIRFEDRVSKELHDLKTEVKQLGSRFAWLLGALAVIVFVANALSIYVLRAIFPPQ